YGGFAMSIVARQQAPPLPHDFERAAERALDPGPLARARARVRGISLDRALIAGADPAGRPELAARAPLLSSPRSRPALAAGRAGGPARRRQRAPPALVGARALRRRARQRRPAAGARTAPGQRRARVRARHRAPARDARRRQRAGLSWRAPRARQAPQRRSRR